MYKTFFKRIFDMLLSGGVLLVFLPFFAILTLVIACAMGGNPFFTQERPGKNNTIFKLIKFRTMTNKRDADGNLLSDAERLTSFGKLLRKLSIDELPELINIFIGDMAIVGPRPLLVRYLPLYSPEQARRHEVRPGLTGLAQVNGRNAISWEDKFRFDVQYVDNITFLGDVKIILLTAKKVFIREGISQEGQATMEFFTGTNTESDASASAAADCDDKKVV